MNNTWNKLLKFITIRPRSEKEILDWLQRKKVDQTEIGQLIGRLKESDLIDDRKFTEWFVDSRMRARPRSRRILNTELRMKGIDKETIEEVLAESGFDEVKMAQKLIEKHSFRWVRFDEKKRKEKIGQFLGRQGFGWDIVRKVMV